jgi:amino acid transporter
MRKISSLCVWLVTQSAIAQTYTGGGLEEGVEQATVLVGNENLRDRAVSIVQTILSYLALTAVVVIVIAGIRLVVSMGEDDAKDKAKRTILYAILGLLLILIAKGLVTIIVNIAN